MFWLWFFSGRILLNGLLRHVVPRDLINRSEEWVPRVFYVVRVQVAYAEL